MVRKYDSLDAVRKSGRLSDGVIDNINAMAASRNMDASAAPNMTIFFSNELEEINTEMAQVLYPDLFYTQDISIDNTGGEGAETLGYYMMDKVGQAQIINRNSKDIPDVGMYVKKYTQTVERIADKYTYTWFDLMNASMAGVPLERDLVMIANEEHERKLNSMAYIGDAKVNKTGLLNNANVTSITSPAGATTSAIAIASMNPDEILAWVKTICTNYRDQNGRRFQPTDLLLPTEAYDHIAMTPVSLSNGSNIFLLDMILQASGNGITRIAPRIECNTANDSGGTRAVLYNSGRNVMKFRVPMIRKSMPTFNHGAFYETEIWSSTAGVEIKYPIAVYYVDGC